jgi:hypothetical protein
MSQANRPFLNRILPYVAAVLCFFALLAAISWAVLSRGIEINLVSIPAAEIHRLFLKVDRGLVIRASQIVLAEDSASGHGRSLDAHLPLLKKWGHLIREIDIKRLRYRNHSFAVAYRQGRFQVLGDIFSCQASVSHEPGEYRLQIDSIRLHPFGLNITGTALYNRALNRVQFSGSFTSPEVEGTLSMTSLDEDIDLRLASGDFDNLPAILSEFPVDREVIDWITASIAVRSYQVNQLRLRCRLAELRDLGPQHISGTAVATGAAIRFHSALPPVLCDRIQISYQNDRLGFLLENPTYATKDLQGSTVGIENLVRGRTRLIIDLQTESRIDNEIIRLLGVYDIPFELRQLTGTTTGRLTLALDLPYMELKADGTFSAGSTTWRWNNIPFQADGISVELHNETLSIRNAVLSYQDLCRCRIAGRIDLSRRHADLLAEIDSLEISVGGTPILSAAQKSIPLEIDFHREDPMIILPELDTTVRLAEQTEITVRDLGAAAPLAPLLQAVDFTKGDLRLVLQDPRHFDFSGEIHFADTLLSLEGRPVTAFHFQGSTRPGQTTISANDHRLTASLTDQLTVEILDYLVTLTYETFKNSDAGQRLPLPVVISGERSLVSVKDFVFPTRNFTFRSRDGDHSFAALLQQGSIRYFGSPPYMTFEGRKLDAALADKFLQNADLTGGTLNVTLQKNREKLEGYLELNNILIRNTLLLNNIVAFVNAVPALATFSSPGFDSEGYRVEEGVMLFTFADGKLTVHRLRTNGLAINTEARGWIDQRNHTVHLEMELITMKDYSKIIEKIPLAGYAILGEDGSLSTSLSISGNLDDPVITTNLTRDIMMTPLNVIRRTVEWPFTLFEGGGSDIPEDPGPE